MRVAVEAMRELGRTCGTSSIVGEECACAVVGDSLYGLGTNLGVRHLKHYRGEVHFIDG